MTSLIDAIYQAIFTDNFEHIAPVVESHTDREPETDYRRPNDPTHVIRIDQWGGKGYPKKRKDYSPVAGSQPVATS